MALEKPSDSSRPCVLVVIRWPVGGIRTWCRYVYRDSAFSMYDIEILMPSGPEALTLQEDLADTNIKMTILGTENSSRSFVIPVARHTLKRRWSLVHSHGFTSGLISAIPCAIRRIPHLVTPHDVVLDEQYRDLRGRVARLLTGLMLRHATCVQAVGRAAKENLEAAFSKTLMGAQQARVVPNGIDTERFLSAQPEALHERCGIPENAIVVGFFGRFMAQKGFRYLVEAVAQYRATNVTGAPMIVVAVGGGGFRREEEAAIRSIGLEENFRFLDFSPNIAGLVKAVDVVVMPSLWEACGLVAMEALVAGMPLVVSNCAGLIEVSDGTPTKVIPMRDSAALLKGILEMNTLEHKLAARNFSHVAAERFDVKKTITGMATLYQALAKT